MQALNTRTFQENRVKLFIFTLFTLFVYQLSAQSVLYVDNAASGTANGLNWTNAYNNLQDALDERMNNGNVDTILVATGTYSPTDAPNGTSINSRDYAFHISDSSVVIIGGYNSTTGIKSSVKSILKANQSNYHIFITSDLSNTEINSFEIRDARGRDVAQQTFDGKVFEDMTGGGFCNKYSNVTYVDCYFYDNQSVLGGAVNSWYGSDSFYNCRFYGNSSRMRTGGSTPSSGAGGAGYFSFSNTFMNRCVIDSNSVETPAYGAIVGHSSGGGLIISSGNYTAENCIFRENYSTNGAGFTAGNSNIEMSNSVFYKNGSFSSFSVSRSAAFETINCKSEITSCSFIENDAYDKSPVNSGYSDSLSMLNCVFFNNQENGGTVNDVYQLTGATGSVLFNSLHNASDVGSSSILDTGGGFVDLNGKHYKDIFLDSTDLIGSDNEWGTADDGLNLHDSSVLIAKGTAVIANTQDIVGTKRNPTPSIGAYEIDICSKASGIIYVDVDATGSNTGLSWANAFVDLQDALDLRMSCDNVDTILVAEGTYYPTSSPDETTADSRKRAFHLSSSNVVVIGGYDPATGTKTGDTTFLDGDLVTAGTASDSAYHVMLVALLNNTTVFENVAIVNGKANAWVNMFYAGRTFGNHSGGGVNIVNASVKFKNVLFDNNYAASGGGAIYVYNGYPHMENSVVSNNRAISGGAVSMINNVGFTISNTVFTNNRATNGGVFYGSGRTSPALTNCVLVNNGATTNGGAYFIQSNSSPTFNYVTFVKNTASNGGAAYFDNNVTPLFSNTVLYDNSATTNNEITLVNSSTINTSSTNNASGEGTGSNLNGIGSGFVDLSSQYYKHLFIDSVDFRGADDVWGTKDDALIPAEGATIVGAGINGTTQDITGFYRSSTPSIGAYEPRLCSPQNVLPTELDSTYISYIRTTDLGNWTHYCSDNGELLLSLNLGNGNAVVNANEVRLKTGASRVFSTTNYGNSFSNTDGYAMIDKRWDVSPTTNNTSGTVGVRYYFTAQDYADLKSALQTKSTTIDSVQQLQMYKATSGTAFEDPHTVSTLLINKGTAASTNTWIYSSQNTTNHLAEFTVSSFSGGGGGAFGGGGSPVPVDLMEFEVTANGKTALLNWSTASEINNSHFVVERSLDALVFEPLGMVKGNGTSQKVLDYGFVDSFIPRGTTKAYYRLKQVDFDGTFEYSEVRMARFKNRENVIVELFPNPTHDKVNIHLNTNASELPLISISNPNGIVINTIMPGSKKVSLDLGEYEHGLYIITINDGGTLKHYKVIKY
jgi:predicted outer membrane repeat protein